MRIPADELLREHAVIRRMLFVLGRLADHVEGWADFPAEDVATVLRFFREFVERVHHRKETECCYGLAVLSGHEEVVESMGELVADHDGTASLLQALLLFWEPGALLEDERIAFASLARRYARRIGEHMDTEEEALYPTLRCRLFGRELDDVLATFDRISERHEGLDVWQRRCDVLESRWRSPQRRTGS